MQAPAVVKAKASGGCPAADYQEKSPGIALFQVRNLCAKSGTGMLGNYAVDLSNGQMWAEDGDEKRIDSPEVRLTRTRMCSLSVKGVIPSLLPQGHTSRAGITRIGTGKPATTASARRKRSTVVR